MARATVQPRADENAFAALLQQQRPRLLQFLRRLCGADAEDVLQETMAKVWRLRGSHDSTQNGAAWLMRAAFHTLCDHRARQRQQPGHADPGFEPAAPAVHCPLELREEVTRCLQTLPPIERELLVGFHGHGLSLRELGERHRLPLNTIKSHLHRARARLATFRERTDDAR